MKFEETEIGKIPETWDVVNMGDLFNIRTGKTDSQDAVPQGKYPLFDRSYNIKRSNKYLFDDEAIIVPGEGKEFIPRYFKGKFDLHQRAYAITTQNKNLCIKFFYYWILYYREYFARTATGATVKSLRLNNFTKFPCPKPPFQEQQKIASILSNYDDLIENNTKRIQLLEKMAKLIYDEWFVKFKFPGHEKVKFVDSELGKIPEGWEVKKLEEYVDFARGIEPGSKNYLEKPNVNTIQFLRVGDLGKRESEIFIDKELANDKILNKNDVVISLDGTIGIVKIGLEGAYSTGIRKVILKENKYLPWSFTYLLLQSSNIQNTIKAYAKGTTILHASSAINHMKFVLPDEDLLKKFELICDSLINNVLILSDKNQNLKKTRDLLIPKLVSGQIDVSDLDIKVPKLQEVVV